MTFENNFDQYDLNDMNSKIKIILSNQELQSKGLVR